MGAKQMVQCCSLARFPQPHLAVREGQEGAWHPQECRERHFSMTCLRDTALSWAWRKNVLMSANSEWHRENNAFLTFLKGHMVLFLAENIKERSNDQKEKRG